MPRFTFALLLIFTSAGLGRAETPALVVQSKSAGALIAEGKAVAKLVGAEAEFDEWLDDTFGEEGLKGLDLAKPILAYAHLKGAATEARLIVIVPITNEADFLALLERMEREATQVTGDKTLYRIGDEDDESALHFRFHKGCAYFSLHGKAKDLDAKLLLDAKDLFAEGDAGLVTVTVRPGLTDAPFRKSLLENIDKGFEALTAFGFIPPNLSVAMKDWHAALTPLLKTGVEDVDEIALRLLCEPGARYVALETTVIPKKGTALAKEIAARKPAPNRFGGMLDWPDAASVLLVQQPAWNAKARESFAPTIKALGQFLSTDMSKEAADAIQVIAAGLDLPGKAGGVELGFTLTAPDKSGFGGAAFALSHADPAALLKALLDYAKNPPEELGEGRETFAKALTLNVAKAGDLSIHTIALKTLLSDELKKRYGEKALLAFAFGKDAMYVTFGPNAVELMKRLVAVKPGAASAVDLRVNAKKLAGWPKDADDAHRDLVERTLGKADKLEPALQLGATGTGELKLRAQLGLPFVSFVREWSERRGPAGE